MSLAKLYKSNKRLSDIKEDDFVKRWEVFSIQKIKDNPSHHVTDSFFHPSAISSYCARQLAFKFIKDPATGRHFDKIQEIDGVGDRKLSNGHYVHDRIQSDFIEAGFIKLCEEKHIEEWGLKLDNTKKESKKWWPSKPLVEVPLKIESYNVSGNCDGILNLPDEPILEIKSINERGFLGLSGPKSEHIIQGNIYCWAMKRKRIYFLYECKNDQKPKGYWVNASKDIITKVAKLLKYTMDCVKENKMPKMQYVNEKDVPCRWCSYKHICYK